MLNVKAVIVYSRRLVTTYGVTELQTRQHWIQHITFAAETNAADTHTDSVTDGCQVTQYLLHLLSDGKGNK